MKHCNKLNSKYVLTTFRFACEDDIFSFEAGRKAPGGSACFAFKCNQAQDLFQKVQQNVRNSRLRPSGSGREALPPSAFAPASQTVVGEATDPLPPVQLPKAPAPLDLRLRHYENVDVTGAVDQQGCQTAADWEPSLAERRVGEAPSSLNLTPTDTKEVVNNNLPSSTASAGKAATIEYVPIDFDPSPPATAAAPPFGSGGGPVKTVEYQVIDFEKTNALTAASHALAAACHNELAIVK